MNKKTSVLITGCSKGFGLLFAEKLAAKGHKVYATGRDLAQAENLVSLAAKYENLSILQMDVINQEHIEAAHRKIEEETGAKLGVLINNAGYGLLGAISELEYPKLQKQFETNVYAPVMITQKFLPLLNAHPGGGLVINISSIASFLGLPSFGAYCASKAALNALSMSLATENVDKNLSVVVIEPGPFKTEFRQSAEKASQITSYSHTRSKLFPTQQDPSEVIDLIVDLVEKKLNDELEIYKEIPVGKNSNFLRILSRWLPQGLLAVIMSKQVAKK
ncbi:MAG: SDR family NAD(P)-dependent oxidoreductase [Candidatus Caenarcaniphilales bacterium]|nr:SDR family NAD(P)-dependent oxidoreductase [Candidatus Caenarcaniphilales bacterium]